MMFDLVVLGGDPAGIDVALRASESGWSTCVVDDPVHFQKFPKLAREAKLPYAHFSGPVQFDTRQSVEIATAVQSRTVTGKRILVACGTRCKRPAHLPFDGTRILDSREAMSSDVIREAALIVGIGEQGLACAGHLIERDVAVSMIDQRVSIPDLHPSAIPELRKKARSIRFGETVMGVKAHAEMVSVFFANGSIESFPHVVFAIGQMGCTGHLRLPDADLILDESLRIWCDDWGQTAIPGVFGIGSVVGFPKPKPTSEGLANRTWNAIRDTAVSGPSFPAEICQNHRVSTPKNSKIVSPSQNSKFQKTS